MSELSKRLKGYSPQPKKDIKEILRERAAMEEPKKTLWQKITIKVRMLFFLAS